MIILHPSSVNTFRCKEERKKEYFLSLRSENGPLEKSYSTQVVFQEEFGIHDFFSFFGIEEI